MTTTLSVHFKLYQELTWVRCVSVATPSGPPHLPFAHRGGRRALEHLVPVCLADDASSQHVVPVARHQLCAALAAREALDVEHVEGRAGLLWRWPAEPLHHLVGGDRQTARRARRRAAEHPAGTVGSMAKLESFYHSGELGKVVQYLHNVQIRVVLVVL